jgi:hypothetical protein
VDSKTIPFFVINTITLTLLLIGVLAGIPTIIPAGITAILYALLGFVSFIALIYPKYTPLAYSLK